MTDRIILAHGNGGYFMRQLIDDVFKRHLANPVIDTDADAVKLPHIDGETMMTVDGFTVQPLEFPGGSIGTLAIHGTVNDLAVAGATPRFLSLSVIIEEGLEITTLDRIVRDMATAAADSNVQVVCGDTKVVPRGEGSGIYITTTGIGEAVNSFETGLDKISINDRILVSGPVGDHGTAIMLAREQFGLKGDLKSDAASVWPLCLSLHDLPGVHFMRDPTRGGLATVLHEICQHRKLGARLSGDSIPVRPQVSTVCEMLGYDPLYLACEGRVVAIVDSEHAEDALTRWQQLEAGQEAAIIGHISNEPGRVILETGLGGERILTALEDDPLPRIC